MMLRLCSKKLLDGAQLRTLSSVAVQSVNINQRLPCLPNTISTAKKFSSAASEESAVSNEKYPYSDPDKINNPLSFWSEAENWSWEWFDGRDTLHIKFKPSTGYNCDWRGVGFFSQEGYWMGILRWNEALRGEDPAIWLHWSQKDPVELCAGTPWKTDADGYCKFRISFTKRELVLHNNGELIGVRKNMIHQGKFVKRIWFSDLIEGSEFMIEGLHTDDSGYHTYGDIPWFQRAKVAWTTVRELQKKHSEDQFPDHGWRS